MKSHSLVQPGYVLLQALKEIQIRYENSLLPLCCVWGGGGGPLHYMDDHRTVMPRAIKTWDLLMQETLGICMCVWGGGGVSRMWDSVQYRCFCIVWMCWCNSRSTWHHCCGKQCGPGASAGTDQQTSLAGESLCWFVFHYINFVQERK